jgi:hypothetical protein
MDETKRHVFVQVLGKSDDFEKRLYQLRMEDGMDLRVQFSVFNTLVRDRWIFIQPNPVKD